MYSAQTSYSRTRKVAGSLVGAIHCTGVIGLLALALSGCSLLGPSSEPSTFAAPVTPGSSPAPASRLDTLGLIAYAASMQGKPYRGAGESPLEGFDCSGLVQHVYGQFELMLPRDVATMAAILPEIPLSAIQATDLLFFNTQGSRYSHVGIYLGDGRFVHAPSPRTGRVIISEVANPYWRGRVTGARRPRLASETSRIANVLHMGHHPGH